MPTAVATAGHPGCDFGNVAKGSTCEVGFLLSAMVEANANATAAAKQLAQVADTLTKRWPTVLHLQVCPPARPPLANP
jgi:hypothetical protein